MSSGALGRRRNPGYVLVGAVLLVTCALVFAVTALRLDPRSAVLAVARTVPAGGVLVAGDVTTVRIVPDAAVQVVPARQLSSVVGRTARVPLMAGSLLAPDQVGPAAWPPDGQAVVAVAVKAGRAPQELVAGAWVTVLVLPMASNGAATAAGGGQPGATTPQAMVVTVGAPDGSGTRVVSLLLAQADAVQVAGAGGDVALVVLGEGG